MFRSVAELVELAEKENIQISEVMIRQEMATKDKSREEVYEEMERNLQVMEQAIEDALKDDGVRSVTGLTGGDAVLVQRYMKEHTPLSGNLIMYEVSKVMGSYDVNAAMRTIFATPTAGSASCLQGMLFAVINQLNPTCDQMVRYLYTSDAFGFVETNNAFIAGAS